MQGAAYDSLEAFYRAAYGETLVEVAAPVALGTTLIAARQGAGDYSDAPVPDLVITRGLSRLIPCTLDVGGGRFRANVPRNAFVVVPPRTQTTILLDRPNMIETLAIPYAPLRALCAEHPLPQDGHFGGLHRHALESPAFTAAFVRITTEIRAGNLNGPMFVEGLLMQLVAMMMATADRPLPIPRGGLAPWQLSRATEYLQEHHAEAVSLRELATLVDLSVFHFARAFKISTGLPPHRYQTAIRMERARLLLATTSAPVTEIAFALGYDSSQSFARAFRGTHAISPTRFRQQRERVG
ncbi:helix-turn-helix transcriptional regulator [Salinarimonas sp. NSM]|uniref:helix-turn-helix transcriptional regulator n=1 Tax=Salinarimonas sp. NSM TaxID=3458003 RepID=UPI0040356324